MIEIIILIAFVANGLIVNPGYQWLLHKLNLNVKPFNCVFCLSFWIGAGYALITLNPAGVVIPLVASFLATAISRWFESLPVKIK